MSRRRKAAIIITVLFVLAWIPFPTVVVPQWKVKVVDIDGIPCVKQTVTQSWAHYSLGRVAR